MEAAENYNRRVKACDEAGEYPFAGYGAMQTAICERVLHSPGTVLDLGFGTGVLTRMLYDGGCMVYGQDASADMVRLAEERMPHGSFHRGDFSEGLVPTLLEQRFDAIIMTYAFHNLPDDRKVSFLQKLRSLLRKNGCLYVGDIAFSDREELEACKNRLGERWNEKETYPIYEELKQAIPELEFQRFSAYAGLLTLRK